MAKIDRIRLRNFRRFVEGTRRQEIDIEFPPEYSTIMIIGDNGTGKTTLVNELNLLPSIADSYDIVEGEIGEKTVWFTHNGTKYKLEYVYRPNGKTHTCSADISKMEKGKLIQLSESSSVTEVRNLIKSMTGVDTKLIKLAMLNSEDRGIVNMKSGARREYMQAISPIGDTKELLKIVSEKYTYAKKTKEANELKIAQSSPLDVLIGDKNSLKAERDNLEKRLRDLSLDNIMSDDEYSKLNEDILNTQNNIDEMQDTLTLLNEYKILGCINDYNSNLNSKIGELSGKISLLLKEISNAEMKIATLTISLNTPIDELKEAIDNHEFHKIKNKKYVKSDLELRNIDRIYSSIFSFIMDIDSLSYGFTKAEVYGDDTLPLDNLLRNYKLLESELILLEGEREKNYVAGEVLDAPSTCNDTSCKLRLYFDEIRDRLHIYNNIIDNIKSKRENLSKLSEDIERLRKLQEARKEVLRLSFFIDSEGKDLSILSPIFKDFKSFKEAYLNGDKINFNEELEDLTYATKVYLSYSSLKEEYDTVAKSSAYELKASMVSWQEEYNACIVDKQELESKLIKEHYNAYFGMMKSDLVKELDKAQTEYVFLKGKREKERDKRVRQEEARSLLNNIEAERDRLDGEISKIDFEIKLLEYIQEELEKATIDEQDMLKVKDTLQKHLPVKVMRRIILNLKEVTNNFLELTDMPYRIFDFEITPKDFVIKVQKGNFVSADISKMSDGEKAIMSLATTLALNSVMLPNYGVFILDEMDATLSATNKQKFLDIVRHFADIKDLQVFAISHNEYYSSANSDSIGILEMTQVGDLKVEPFI